MTFQEYKKHAYSERICLIKDSAYSILSIVN